MHRAFLLFAPRIGEHVHDLGDRPFDPLGSSRDHLGRDRGALRRLRAMLDWSGDVVVNASHKLKREPNDLTGLQLVLPGKLFQIAG
jgi:hypothetical protein